MAGPMKEKRSNIVLIGMPGSGKSTVGIILAKQLACDFVDTDVLIQTAQGRSLQAIVDGEGYLALRRIEEETLLALHLDRHVIATGGSAVYSHAAMTHLKSSGSIVFLDVQLTTLKARVNDYETRGLAKRPDQCLADLFAERFALYTRYADVTISCDRVGHEEVCARIRNALSGTIGL
jgi:shikimate kinase